MRVECWEYVVLLYSRRAAAGLVKMLGVSVKGKVKHYGCEKLDWLAIALLGVNNQGSAAFWGTSPTPGT